MISIARSATRDSAKDKKRSKRRITKKRGGEKRKKNIESEKKKKMVVVGGVCVFCNDYLKRILFDSVLFAGVIFKVPEKEKHSIFLLPKSISNSCSNSRSFLFVRMNFNRKS